MKFSSTIASDSKSLKVAFLYVGLKGLALFQSTGEAQEVLSLRQGPVRLLRMLKTPLEGIVSMCL